MQSRFEGIWVPIVTPFSGDNIDHTALARITRYLADSGVAGLIAGATTGEGALLRPSEQEAIFATLRETAPNLPVVLGLSHAATGEAVAQARALASLQPAGLLATAPVYVRPTQEGIRRHFEAIVESAGLPLLIYNIPYRSGVNVELETLQALATDSRVAGVKECGGSMERLMRLVHETPLAILSGDDSQNFSALCAGAHGTIAASAHILPHWHVRIYELLRDGQLAAARQIAVALQPIIRSLFAEPNPAPLKAWLEQHEFCNSEVRLPFISASSELQERLLIEWERLQTFTLPIL